MCGRNISKFMFKNHCFFPRAQISFPGATNEALLQKFNSVHKNNPFYEKPQKKENAFIIKHYAGKVKYQVCDFISIDFSFLSIDYL